MCCAPESCDVGEYGYENHTAGKPPYICHATSEHGCDSCHHNSFGALHQSNLALDVQSLGSGTYVAHHYWAYHGCKGDDAHPKAHLVLHAQEVKADAEEAYQFAIAVECRVP